ncbi:hypothetical protein CAPTEDRAFT_191881 [Capitella teleta]|uniref:Uncharacterized protein n=1 Tax=Capitella teleta TaxID=283909 RepID=R7UXK8_CAPTE|nr:hypothetical protein CAPTEDRAFT_191881 [Capitella teleta]|eukprot:ELU11318.1 hypothetical protein CAPTEDRAFT_191881 [Capitella teleta]
MDIRLEYCSKRSRDRVYVILYVCPYIYEGYPKRYRPNIECVVYVLGSRVNVKHIFMSRSLVARYMNASARPSGLWYLVSNEGLRKGCLPQQLMLYPGFSTMTEGKVDDLVEYFKEVLNKENYEELHLPFSENVRPPLEEALVKMSELFTLERSSSLRSHTLAPKAFLASLEAMLATVQKQ